MSRSLLPFALLWLLPIAQVWAEEQTAAEQLADGNTKFAVQLYGQLAKEDGNVLFSPYSISSALGMTYGGARNNTAAEMQQALNFPFGQDKVHPAFQQLKQALAAAGKKSGVKLNIANGLCLTGGNVSPDFQNLLTEYYDAELFAGDVEVINAWVKKKTQGKIEKILESLSADSVAVILNAIYFKGDWNSMFQDYRTQDAPFKVSPGKTVKVRLMYQRQQFAILDRKEFQVASLPYSGKRMEMVVLLPRKVDGLAQLEQELTAEKLAEVLTQLDRTSAVESDIYLPKFTLETEYGLTSACQALGINDAFSSSKADFTGTGWPVGKLWISQIKHKAFMEVNEQGTEAAAATAVELQTESVRLYPVFQADHPFLFLIRDKETGSILFMGRMVDPSSK